MMDNRDRSAENGVRKRYAAPQVLDYGAVSDLVRGFKMPYIEIEGKRDTVIT